MPKVSIYVPVYNTESLLPRALDSLINQTLQDIEIIVVNDGSPGNCIQIVQEYQKKDPRIKFINNPKNLGTYMSTLKAMSTCIGKYIARLDSDDTFELNALEVAYDAAKTGNFDICYYSSNWIYPENYNGKKMTPYLGEGTFKQEEAFSLLFTFNKRKKAVLYGVWGLLVKQEIAKKALQILPNPLKLKMAEDFLQHVAFLIFTENAVMIPHRLYNYHLNIGITSKRTLKQWFYSSKNIHTVLSLSRKLLLKNVPKKEIIKKFNHLCLMEYLFLVKKFLLIFKR